MTFTIEDDFSIAIDDNRTLWLTEISKKTFLDQSLESLESDSGLFVVVEDTTLGSFEVLAKAASTTTGMELLDILASTFKLEASPHLIK